MEVGPVTRSRRNVIAEPESVSSTPSTPVKKGNGKTAKSDIEVPVPNFSEMIQDDIIASPMRITRSRRSISMCSNPPDSPSRTLTKKIVSPGTPKRVGTPVKELSLTKNADKIVGEMTPTKRLLKKTENLLLTVDSPKPRKSRLSLTENSESKPEFTNLRRSRRLSTELNVVEEDPIKEAVIDSSNTTLARKRRTKTLSVIPTEPSVPEENSENDSDVEILCEKTNSSHTIHEDRKEVSLILNDCTKYLSPVQEKDSMADENTLLSNDVLLLNSSQTNSDQIDDKENISTLVKGVKSPIILLHSIDKSMKSPNVTEQNILNLSGKLNESTPFNRSSKDRSHASPMDTNMSLFLEESPKNTSRRLSAKEIFIRENVSDSENTENKSSSNDSSIDNGTSIKNKSINTSLNYEKNKNNSFDSNKSIEKTNNKSFASEASINVEKNKDKSFNIDSSINNEKSKNKSFNRDISISNDKTINKSFDNDTSINNEKSTNKSFNSDNSINNDKTINKSFDNNTSINNQKSKNKSTTSDTSINIDKTINKSFDNNTSINNQKSKNKSYSSDTSINNDKTINKSFDNNTSVNNQKSKNKSFSSDTSINNDKTINKSFDNNTSINNQKSKNKSFSSDTSINNDKTINESFDNATNNEKSKDKSFNKNTSINIDKTKNKSFNNDKSPSIEKSEDVLMGMDESTPLVIDESKIGSPKKDDADLIDIDNSLDVDETTSSPEKSDDEISSEDENDLKITFSDSVAEDAGSDYQSGDSMNESERRVMEDNEIVERGHTLNSEDEEDSDDTYEKDSFVCSSDEEDNILLSGSGDDLSSGEELTQSSKSKAKYNAKSEKKQKRASKEMFTAKYDSANTTKSPNNSGKNQFSKVNNSEIDASVLNQSDEKEMTIINDRNISKDPLSITLSKPDDSQFIISLRESSPSTEYTDPSTDDDDTDIRNLYDNELRKLHNIEFDSDSSNELRVLKETTDARNKSNQSDGKSIKLSGNDSSTKNSSKKIKKPKILAHLNKSDNAIRTKENSNKFNHSLSELESLKRNDQFKSSTSIEDNIEKLRRLNESVNRIYSSVIHTIDQVKCSVDAAFHDTNTAPIKDEHNTSNASKRKLSSDVIKEEKSQKKICIYDEVLPEMQQSAFEVLHKKSKKKKGKKPERSSLKLSEKSKTIKRPRDSISDDTAKKIFDIAAELQTIPTSSIPTTTLKDFVATSSFKVEELQSKRADNWTDTAGRFHVTKKAIRRSIVSDSTTSFNVVSLKKHPKQDIKVEDVLTSKFVNFKNDMLYGKNVKREPSTNIKKNIQKLALQKMQHAVKGRNKY